MAKLTITVDDEILRRARMMALEQNTSVNSLLRDYLEAFAAAAWDQATNAILGLSSRAESGRGNAAGPAMSCMSAAARIFHDTPVLVYLLDQSAWAPGGHGRPVATGPGRRWRFRPLRHKIAAHDHPGGGSR